MTAFTPRFPTVELALDIHAEMLSQYGGLDGVRDYAQLEAAIAAPQMTMGGDFLNPTLPKMAAALLVSLCQGHPFLDGNKRTATVLAFNFLAANGLTLEMDEGTLETLVMRVAEGHLGKEEVAAAFAAHVTVR